MVDVSIAGGGVIGLAIARACAMNGLSVRVFEKEQSHDRHQSGRNSGVIHPGYNLKPGSMKARICVPGAHELKAFCTSHDVPVVENGILVVDPTGDRTSSVQQVADNAHRSGIKGRTLDGDEIPAIEPQANGHSAFHCPSGASIDSKAYMQALARDVKSHGVEIITATRIHSMDQLDGSVKVNAAGLWSDMLTDDRSIRIVPFRGQYHGFRKGRRPDLKGHIYAAPHPEFPFLGIHLSPSTAGDIWAGPSASLALGRDWYNRNIPPIPSARTLFWPGFWRMAKGREFRQQVRLEWKKSLSVRAVATEAKELVPSIRRQDIIRGPSSRIGHRAQMVTRDGKLVDDIVVKQHGTEIHILNAVSPGLTGSLPFGRTIAEDAASILNAQ